MIMSDNPLDLVLVKREKKSRERGDPLKCQWFRSHRVCKQLNTLS